MLIFTDGGDRKVIKWMLFLRALSLLYFIFYDQISRIKKKIHHVQGQKPSIKCADRERGSKLMIVRTHMDYLIPTENENVLLSQRCIYFILPYKFWISIHNVANCPIKINMKSKWSESVCTPLIVCKKGAASSSELLIYFRYNNHIQDRKLVLDERNMDEMITQ